jgi:hypothetical protein
MVTVGDELSGVVGGWGGGEAGAAAGTIAGWYLAEDSPSIYKPINNLLKFFTVFF